MKRATGAIVLDVSKVDISIHALVKRATYDTVCILGYDRDFNPRPREEGDYTRYGIRRVMNDFNPRPREEGDNVPL